MIRLLRRAFCHAAAAAVLMGFWVPAGNVAPPALAQDTLRAVAVVNDEVISTHDLQMRTRLAALAAGIDLSQESQMRLQRQVLRRLIDERLQVQEAERLSITVDDEDVTQAIDGLARTNGMSPDQFHSLLIQNRIHPLALEQRVRAELAWQNVVHVRLVPTVVVGDEEINEMVARVEANLGSPEVRLSEIFLEVDSVLDDDEVMRSAGRLIEQLRGGADFDSLARQFSQSVTAPVGGDMGWIQEAQLPEELTGTVRNMRPGEIAGPVRGFSGYHILLLRNRRSITGSESGAKLKQVFLEAPADATDQQIADLVSKAAGLRDQIESCADADRIAAEAGSPGSGDLGTVKIRDLPAKLQRVVQTLPLEKPSDPLEVTGGISVLIVCERQGGRVNRAKIENDLRLQRINMLARRYLRDLRRAANVDIRL